MNTKNILRLFVASAIVIVLLFTVGLANRPDAPTNGNNVFKLQPPPFISVARAAPETAPLGIIENEAGIAAYFKAPGPINLNDARTVFRTIEISTTSYIIGSVPVLNYDESNDVHVYVHVDGWVLAYYLKADPTGKIFDWRGWNGGTSIPTKLENTLAVVGSAVGAAVTNPAFYHFQYPNANTMMLIAESLSGGNTFTVKLPSSFIYYDRSWSLIGYGYPDYWNLDGATIGSCSGTCQGTLSASQLPVDTTHTISVEDNGGLALIYRVP